MARTSRKPAAPRAGKTVVALMAVGALLGGAGAASADGTGTHPSGAPTGDGAKGLCKRVPKIDRRIERILGRLNGDASQRGSIARLEQRLADAKSAGDTRIETYLDHRLAFRRSLVPTLESRQKDLADVRKWCASHDDGTGS
ncbi:hypothetical protein ACFVU0_08715 [Streptomyces sp. NPDC058122]|uniref:hypothetical protein n=1 Tax=Streptomyces sp. NPDC058122 TaxID=3346349 RepID=UPI0036E0C3D7